MGFKLLNLKVLFISLLLMVILSSDVSAITAKAGIVPTQGYVPLMVRFTDLSEGTPIEWYWDLGDGFTESGPQFIHTYLNPGIYTVKLLVVDKEGKSDTAEYSKVIRVSSSSYMPLITINSPSFTADFTATPLKGQIPLLVNFTDLSKGEPSVWNWNFGDGFNSSEKSPVHMYTNPGSYSVILEIAKENSNAQKGIKNYITAYIEENNNKSLELKESEINSTYYGDERK
jgi:PKD repeat protein